MSRKRRYRLTPEAEQDVRGIGEYIAAERPATARRVIQAIRATFSTLSRSPYIGERCEHLGAGLRRITADSPAQRYVIFFRPDEAGIGVQIHSVLDGSRDLDALFGPSDV